MAENEEKKESKEPKQNKENKAVNDNESDSCVDDKCVGVVDESDLEVRCPYCHSNNVKRVSTLYKTVDLLLRGIYAMDRIGVKWHCNNCGKDF